MDSNFSLLVRGLSTALEPQNLLFALLGSLLGTLVGVLPGIGPTSAIALLLPLTSVLAPTPAVIMLAAIYYGAMYGGSTTAILINTPGEVSSVVTALDGYQLARQGKAGVALSISAIGSFVAGTLGVVALTFFAPALADVALAAGPPEYFALMLLALSVVVNLAGRSLWRGLAAAAAGFFVAMVGTDPVTGTPRFTFGQPFLWGGIDFISAVIGLFAISEVLSSVESSLRLGQVSRIERLLPNRDELRRSTAPILRSSVLGFLLGLLPGMSPGVTSFLVYDTEKRLSKNPEQFGKGAIEGVAAAESANNATCSGGFIPLFALGIPASPALAVLLGGLQIYGLQPGPLLFEKHAEFAWAVIASMYVGNVILLLLNLPLVGLWARVALIPPPVLNVMILGFSFVGAYSVRNSMFDVWSALAFGVLGYLMRKVDFPVTPLVLGLILEPMVESSLRQAVSMSRGDLSVFLGRPVALAMMAMAVVLTALSLYARWRRAQAVGAVLGAGAEVD